MKELEALSLEKKCFKGIRSPFSEILKSAPVRKEIVYSLLQSKKESRFQFKQKISFLLKKHQWITLWWWVLTTRNINETQFLSEACYFLYKSTVFLLLLGGIRIPPQGLRDKRARLLQQGTYPALHPLSHEDAVLLDKSDRIRLPD